MGCVVANHHGHVDIMEDPKTLEELHLWIWENVGKRACVQRDKGFILPILSKQPMMAYDCTYVLRGDGQNLECQVGYLCHIKETRLSEQGRPEMAIKTH